MTVNPNIDGIYPDEIIRISFDLETMGLGPDAAIVQLGAYAFSGHNYSADLQFNKYIDPEDSEKYGTVDRETMDWWDKQPVSTRASVFSGKNTLESALTAFEIWVSKLCNGDFKRVKFYCKDIGLDWCALRHGYEKTIGTFPFHYRSPQQLRTLQDVATFVGLEYDHAIYKPVIPHNAAFDALAQGKEAAFILESLRKWTSFNGIDIPAEDSPN